MRYLSVLGSTGSIGVSTLEVVARHPEKFSIVSLSANDNVDLMFKQCLEFQPAVGVMVCPQAAERLNTRLVEFNHTPIKVLSGTQALVDIVCDESVDTVMAAIVGASGLIPTLAAVKRGKRVLLANKESLVTSGQIFIDAASKSGAQVLPIDSEHNAIFQCLPVNAQEKVGYCDLASDGVSKILLTGSGGPFREYSLEDLAEVTPEQACAHPN